jgi:hypothetical protein
MHESGEKWLPNQNTMTPTTEADTYPELTDEQRERILAFVRECGLSSQYSTQGAIKTAQILSDREILSQIDYEKGLITDMGNIIGLVFEAGDVADDLLTAQGKMKVNAVGVEQTSNDTRDLTVFTFPNGNRAAFAPDRIEQIETVYETNLQNFPQKVKSHEENDDWAIQVDDSESNTYMMLAPLAVDY